MLIDMFMVIVELIERRRSSHSNLVVKTVGRC